jgi:hypothetical protein
MRRRGRGQHRKPGQHHHHHHHHQGRNQTFDSNGPSVRLRGTAHQIYEKYLTLGRDSAASGDRIMSENYFQHADHYYRHILANQGPLEEFRERAEGQDGELEAETSGFGQGEQPQPGEGQSEPAYASTVPQPQGYNGGGPSQGTSLPGGNQPRHEGQREGRLDDRRGDERRGDERGEGQGQHHGNFRRDRFNRRFRNRDDRPYQDQGGGDRREGRDERSSRDDRGNREDRSNRDGNRDDRGRDRQQRHQDEAFEPPAFLKAERPAGETPPRDPFNRDDEQH